MTFPLSLPPTEQPLTRLDTIHGVSLRAAATAAVDRHRSARPTGALRESRASDAGAGRAAGDIASQLILYIPAELVAAYAAVVGVLPLPGGASACAGDFGARWIAFAVFVLLTPVTLQALYVVKRRSAGGVGPRVPWFEHAAAVLAFVAWAVALPLSPVTSWCDWQPQYGAAIGATLLLVLGLAAQLARPLR